MTLKNSTMGNESISASEFENRWDKFRDALRWEDQLIFDEMFEAPVIHRDAIGSMTGSEFEKMVMAMIIEQRKIGDEIEAKMSGIEKRLTAVAKKNA